MGYVRQEDHLPHRPHSGGAGHQRQRPQAIATQSIEESDASEDRDDERAGPEGADSTVLEDLENTLSIPRAPQCIARVGETVLVQSACERERCADDENGIHERAQRP